MRRVMPWIRTNEAHWPFTHRLWTSACVLVGVAIMTTALGGSARPLAAARRPRPAKITDVRDASADARHLGEPTAASQPTVNGFVTRAFTDPSGATMVYYLHIPPGVSGPELVSDATRYPVVLLLQGSGERANPSATDEQNRARAVTTPYIRLWSSSTVQAQWPSFIIVPQVISPNRWVNAPPRQGSYTLAPTPTSSLTLAHDILQATLAQYSAAIDSQRVYVTGISMGGFGVWEAIERWPQDFAAAAPVSGAGDPSKADAIAQMPIWVFHGAQDATVPVSGSRDMIAAITAAGGHPNLTEYPNAKHDIWLTVYDNQTFLTWLFAQDAGA